MYSKILYVKYINILEILTRLIHVFKNVLFCDV